MEAVEDEAESLTDDDVTDKRYQLEDKKRKIAQKIDSATKNKRIQKATDYYYETKTECEELIDNSGNDHERKTFNDIVSQDSIIGQIRWRTPDFLKGIFAHLQSDQSKMNDQSQAKSLVDAGNFAIESQNWDRLREINFGLLDLLPRGSKEDITTKIGFGL